mmetsp:Transcript_44197/g.32182  ORF Transcript_44197/g.32182 Transcript_44197/m.32182 type:complete len:113 (+) Transcript_44197:679-1017(+)
MGGLRYVSLATIIAIFYTFMVLLVEMPAYIKQNWNSEGYKIVYACFDLNLFTGISITFLAFACNVQVLPLYSVLVNPNERRMKKVVNRSILVDAFFYICIAYSGYFSTLNHT